MVCRTIVSLIAGLALLLPATLLGAFDAAPSEPTPLPTDARRALADGAEEDILVEWVLRIEDLVACETAAPELRRIQHRYRDRLRLVAYPIATDTALVRSFLRRERLTRFELQPLSERELERHFGGWLGEPARTPSLVVVSSRGERVETFDAAVRSSVGRPGVDTFTAYVDTLLRSAAVAVDFIMSPSILTRGER